MNHASREVMTHLEPTWLEKRIEQWLRFGHALETQPIDRYRRRLCFAPGTVFALLRWTQADCGAAACCIDIVRAPHAGEPRERLPFVPTGADRLLHRSGWAEVRTVLAVIDALERRRINPVHVCPSYWQQLANGLQERGIVPSYTTARHEAWLCGRTTP
ncbi:hypothetical protein CFR79_12950 [Komagataeibacter saccharivorans]|uniref:DUF2840 domain-containing protein n=1 Tax=Komagataeibacter saccharivorans TaxID=265959 RepID=UPI000D7BD74E|nr:DUF2840 domain-containing protein [Komagataeibacter saccharivorans]PYD49784.1 hypothetical protein CFR79_12950 [Komagataeibacter saccharivorans]